ncbi:MAG: amidohydrolase [Bacillota bacterium]
MDKGTAKKRALQAIDDYTPKIQEFHRDIWEHPELGYKEHRTAAKVAEFFEDLGLEYKTGLALTGVRAEAHGKSDDVRVAVMGELDAVINLDHPAAVAETGAVHACGHHSQLAAMLGTAVGLSHGGLLDSLGGDVAFIAVPAEEFVELGYRSILRERGDIEFFGGKQELIRLGVLDDIDMAMIVHLQAETPERVIKLAQGFLGFLGKTVRYLGREAHPAAEPHKGINALNAAMLGLISIHAQRETFRDQDSIRVHPIITRGGDLVNVVPAEVTLETYVRGRNIDAIMDANVKVNRSLSAGALAIGAEVQIEEIPGYLPLRTDDNLIEIFSQNAKTLLAENSVFTDDHDGGSTDMGDISHLMPAIHPMIGGVRGRLHARDYEIVDPDMTNIVPAKIMAMTLIDLLWDEAREAKRIKREFHPLYSKEGYLKMWRDLVEAGE